MPAQRSRYFCKSGTKGEGVRGQAIAVQKEGRPDRVLINAMIMTACPSLVDMWHLVESYPQLEAPRRTRLAAIRPQVPGKTDVAGFFETICKNRCYNAKAFHIREDAEGWLRKKVLLELPGRFSLDGLRGAERRQSF